MSPGIWVPLSCFTALEALQAAGYLVADDCGAPANRVLTALSMAH